MKISLEELLAFTAVIDSGSITAAAEQLEQTVSGISRALGRLERKLGTTLMRRTDPDKMPAYGMIQTGVRFSIPLCGK